MKPRTLSQMQHLPTAYEVAINGDVVGYTARKTKQALLAFARDNASKILSQIPDDMDPPAEYTKGKWSFGSVAVYFTGRTEREAATEMGLR